MLKGPILFPAVLSFAMLGTLQSQAHVQDSVSEPKLTGSPFPSSPDLRSKIKIQLVRHGCLGPCPQYSITVYGNGNVLFEGGEEVRVKGRARSKLSEKAVDDLILKINQIDFFAFQPRHGDKCVTDGATASIVVSEPGREKQISDECIEGREIEDIEAAIDNAVRIQRWVFIDAKELRTQIGRGWDITIHGEEYAGQAIEWNDPEVLRVLVQNGIPVDARNNDGETLLLQAVFKNRYASAKVLLELGANPKAIDLVGSSPSQNAGHRSIEMCKLFLSHGARIDDQDGMGETMLMNAARSTGNFEIVKFLVDSGANVNLRSKNGETAIGVALRMRQQFQESINSTFNPNYQLLADPEIARANDRSEQKQYENVVQYLRQHGGSE
jgi:uncharacterized protein